MTMARLTSGHGKKDQEQMNDKVKILEKVDHAVSRKVLSLETELGERVDKEEVVLKRKLKLTKKFP